MDKIKQQIDDILITIEEEKRKYILDFFVKDVKVYSKRLIKLSQKTESSVAVSAETNKRYHLFTNEILQKAGELENLVNQRIVIQKIKNVFRMFLIDSPVYESLLVKRAFDKPRGYPGDYQMIELFYDNQPISKGIGFCGDKFILNDNYVKAIRNRKDGMLEILVNYIKSSKSSSINILNIGCGSCREIRELFLSGIKTRNKINLTLIDQDKDALDFSRYSFKKMSSHIPKNIKFKFVKENVFNFFKNKKYQNMFKGQNIIYSIGLADYLPDLYLGRLIKSCSELLESKGQLIIAHKNIKQYKALAPAWFCDWSFFPRNKRNLIDIGKTYIDQTNYDVKFKEAKSKYIFFMLVNKL